MTNTRRRNPRTSNKGKKPIKIGRTIKRGLNSREKSQVKKIVASQAETKYFHSTPADSIQEIQPAPTVIGANMYAKGFSATTAYVRTGAVSSSALSYGTAGNLEPLNLSRVFEPDNTDPDLASYSLDGDDCQVSFANSKWLIERTAVDTTALADQTLDCLPMLIRVIRVSPKAMKGSYVWNDPQKDLFLDQYDKETGVTVSGFSKNELALLKTNRRRYNIKEDKQFVLLAPVTTFDNGVGAGQNQATNITSNCRKVLTMRHDIGKKFHYDRDTSQGTTYPDFPLNGLKTEWIFFHFQLIGDNSAVRNSADNVRISCIPSSAFKDL